MNFAVVIPDRGDRPAFMANCLRMITPQLPKEHIYIYNEYLGGPDGKPDISQKYIKAYFELGEKYDLLFFIENDDWYAPDYIQVMLKLYEQAKHPPLFGIGYTYYYHLGLRKYFRFLHPDRASMMSTCVRTNLPELAHVWRNTDGYVQFLDMQLWRLVRGGVAVSPSRILSVGIKHGVGALGGSGHTSLMHRYTEHDNGFLKRHLDKESYGFYNNIVTPQSWAGTQSV